MNSPWLKFLPGKGRAGAKLPLLLGSVDSTTGSHGRYNSRCSEGVLFPAYFEANYPRLSQHCAGESPSLPWASLDWLLPVTGQLELG